ncbi:hypothetical protein [uncultured Sphingomonas sp.]|uniref:hypothetical protein n=1 Tax=uncultured Sphingomonas sp. TaxID=158754 RepID=UPI0025E3FC0F|nr:hypothetical protein [uncultured Sphingomonas sp.]
MGKLPLRLLGVALLGCSGGSTLVHRGVYEAARHGPAQAAEFGLALLTFILASTGMLLLVYGAKLFIPAPDRLRRGEPRTRAELRARLEAPIAPQGRAFDTRHGASMMQARHRVGLSRRARLITKPHVGKLEGTSIDRTSAHRR